MSMQKKLYRNEEDRMLGGVCSGLAQYFSIDPLLVRVIFVLLALNGFGVILYLALWAVIPTERISAEFGTEDVVRHNLNDMAAQIREFGQRMGTSTQGPVIVGLVLVVLGVVFLLHQFVPWISMGLIWPIMLIVVGAYMLFRQR